MAADPSELLAPAGDLLPEMFPGESAAAVLDRLAAYITDGTQRTAAITDEPTRDRAVRHWAYARAYGAIFVRLSHAPATVDVANEVSTSRLEAQITTFRALRDEHRAAFDALVADAAAPDTHAPTIPLSGTTELGVTW